MSKVILIHGFNKNSKDMKPLERHLLLFGYDCIIPTFPLTYKEFDYSADVLERLVDKIIEQQMSVNEKIHLVGHSTGGLVIRKLLAQTKYINQIGRCVLVATPNNGSQLAELASKVKGFNSIYKTLLSLRQAYIKNLQLPHHPHIEIGAIAGVKNNLLLGKFISDKNDGRIEIQSVWYSDLTDFLVLPYGHKEIHHQEETAKKIHQFLQTGKFL